MTGGTTSPFSIPPTSQCSCKGCYDRHRFAGSLLALPAESAPDLSCACRKRAALPISVAGIPAIQLSPPARSPIEFAAKLLRYRCLPVPDEPVISPHSILESGAIKQLASKGFTRLIQWSSGLAIQFGGGKWGPWTMRVLVPLLVPLCTSSLCILWRLRATT